ncbi:MAG: DUF1552 domain-containing protein [Planctomycetaceae bacterium]
MSSRSKRTGIQRRTVLRGTGVTLGLPWLASVPVFGTDKAADQSVATPPQRFAALFMACGINGEHWWAKQSESGIELSSTLSPLAPFTDRLNVINGLFNRNATGVGIHPGQTGNILSGASLQKGAELRGGISIDQLLANHLGQETVQPSLVLGCEQPVTGYHETNFSMAYSSHISWQNATSPVPMEVYPALAFDSLTENRGQQRDRGILDRVRSEIARLNRQASFEDRSKIDEYLTRVREVEKRIEQLRVAQEKAATNATNRGTSVTLMDRPDNGLPEDIQEHMKLMCDIIAMAFQTDRTRFATLLLCRDISGLFYPFLNVRKAHHSGSHDDRSEDWEKVSRYYVSQAAYLAERLAAMPEADGTVLDHSCLLFVNNMWSGSRHDSTKLPLFTLGGLQGKLKTGRVLDYTKAADNERKLCSLYLSIMHAMGLKADHFGDANQLLAGL